MNRHASQSRNTANPRAAEGGGGVLRGALLPVVLILLAVRLALPSALALVEQTPVAPESPARLVPAADSGEAAPDAGGPVDSAATAAGALLARFAPLG